MTDLPQPQDIISGDEICSDTNKIIDAGNGLWEIDGKMIKKGAENFGLSQHNAQGVRLPDNS